jgi:glycosyltransferase involved in cell wall biosynthesis
MPPPSSLRPRKNAFRLYRCNERVSPLGIEPPPAAPEAKEKFFAAFPGLRATRILLFLGRLHPKKGCDLLLDAFPRNSELSLVLAGPDQVGWEIELRRRVDHSAASRVIFTGMLEGEMKRGALAVADAFILPSHQENFGMAVVEALAAGLPVLISNRINIWREIEADRAGLVEPDDLPGTKRLIERWCKTDAPERETMRVNARRCFDNRFHIDRAVDSLLSILSEPEAKPSGNVR